MHWLGIGVAILIGCAVIAIGAAYLFRPWSVMPSFGLPLPNTSENTIWWLRLKGVRDIVSGIVLFALVPFDGHRLLGLVLLLFALIPLGDMATILAAGGRTRTAFGVHGVTAALMVLGGAPLLLGVR